MKDNCFGATWRLNSTIPGFQHCQRHKLNMSWHQVAEFVWQNGREPDVETSSDRQIVLAAQEMGYDFHAGEAMSDIDEGHIYLVRDDGEEHHFFGEHKKYLVHRFLRSEIAFNAAYYPYEHALWTLEGLLALCIQLDRFAQD